MYMHYKFQDLFNKDFISSPTKFSQPVLELEKVPLLQGLFLHQQSPRIPAKPPGRWGGR